MNFSALLMTLSSFALCKFRSGEGEASLQAHTSCLAEGYSSCRQATVAQMQSCSQQMKL